MKDKPTPKEKKSPNLTDNHIKVIKELCSDCTLFGKFMGAVAHYISKTTNVDKFKSEFETSYNFKVIYKFEELKKDAKK